MFIKSVTCLKVRPTTYITAVNLKSLFQNEVIDPNLKVRNSVRSFSVVLDFEVMWIVKKHSGILFSLGIVHYFVDSLS